mgnify:CR=1 FL=1
MKTGNTESDKIIKKMTQEPIMVDADELTANILAGIDREEQYPAEGKGRSRTISIIQKSLAVASVIIVLIFGIEQYIVINKVTQLEIKVSNIAHEKSNISFGNFVNYNTSMMLPDIKKIRIEKYPANLKKNLKTKIMLSRLGSLAINHANNIQVRSITNH